MPSSFSWLDHSGRDRRRVLEAIDRFGESDTRDELGLSTIRDTFADLFFPGTTVLQTRARYFLFVPWLYGQLEARRVGADRFAASARKAEIRLIDALKAGGELRGVIGARAGSSLKRLASNVYWLGLGRWNIRLFASSQDDYHSSIDSYYRRTTDLPRDDDNELLARRAPRNWHADLPPCPSDLLERAVFELSVDEARYLQERILFSAPDTLLAFLARRGKDAEVAFAWQHPQYGEFPEPIQAALQHARTFAEVMHGAALLYNLILADTLPAGAASDDHKERYRQALRSWSEELRARDAAIASWDRTAFWALLKSRARIKGSTRRFVEDWISLGTWRSGTDARESREARTLVQQREMAIKGARSRVASPRALELWTGASGVGRFDYRWRTASQLVRDIRTGLGGTDARA